MKSSFLKNAGIYPITLPFPFQGVLRAGEEILTRYSVERLRWLIDQVKFPATNAVRELKIRQGRVNAQEADISDLSPPRDYFHGYCRTVDASPPAKILWKLDLNDSERLPASVFNTGAHQIRLTVVGARKGASDFSAYERLIRFQVDPSSGSIINAVTQTIGADTNTDATAISVTVTASGVEVQMSGVLAKTYDWSAEAYVSSVIGAAA